jgi:hypothetical protein
MKKTGVLLLFSILSTLAGQGQNNMEELPFREIPAAPDHYNAGTVVARMIEGLGFRYYWATEGLREKDLDFKPSSEARTCEETLDHILGLSTVILNSALHQVNSQNDISELKVEEKRKLTLDNLKTAADIFRQQEDLHGFTIVFKGDNADRTFPFWNQINGPISDAIWHCGQIVSMRRSSGNPFSSRVSVFTGTIRD